MNINFFHISNVFSMFFPMSYVVSPKKTVSYSFFCWEDKPRMDFQVAEGIRRTRINMIEVST